MTKEMTMQEALEASKNADVIKECNEKYMPKVWAAIEDAARLGKVKTQLKWNETYSEYAVQILLSKGFLASCCTYGGTYTYPYSELEVSWGAKKQ